MNEKLNFILATCAILISAASFYATYLQADSAERQVKAMTLPFIQFSHGNFDEQQNAKAIELNLKNAGVGPAVIKRFQIQYRQEMHDSIESFLLSCCENQVELFREKRRQRQEQGSDEEFGGWLSQPLVDVILPGQSEYQFQRISYGEDTRELWDKLNDERWHMNLHICYCSLLEECFVSKKNGVIEEVKSCPLADTANR